MTDTTPARTPQARILYADILRIVATFFIVLIHTSTFEWFDAPVTSLHWVGLNFYDSLSRWAVTAFLMLSGMLFLDPAVNRPTVKIYTKYIPRIACALVFWDILYGCVHLAARPGNPCFTDIVRIPLSLLFSPQIHLWFLYVIIGLYILTPLLRVFTRHAEKKDVIYFLALFLVFGTLLPGVNFIIHQTLHLSLYKHIIIPGFASFIGAFVAGYFFSHYEISKTARRVFYALGIASWCIAFFGTWYFALLHGEPDEYLLGNLRTTTFLIAVAAFLFVRERFKDRVAGPKMQKVISELSACTFGIYLVHPLFLMTYSKMHGDLYFWPVFISVPVAAFVIFALSLAAIFLVRKILPGVSRWIT